MRSEKEIQSAPATDMAFFQLKVFPGSLCVFLSSSLEGAIDGAEEGYWALAPLELALKNRGHFDCAKVELGI